MAILSPTPRFQGFDNNGNPLVGGGLYTTENKTDTPKISYQNESETIVNTNPIVLDSRGECDLWLVEGEAYRLRLEDSLGNTIWERDDIIGGAGGNIQISKIADLKDTSPSSLTLAFVLGYYEPGDGGGGLWYWNATSTSSENGVTVIELNSLPSVGRWERVDTENITFKQSGAKGDGAFDDTAFINSAITWVDANNKTLIATEGTYLISGSLAFGSSTNLKMEKGASFIAGSLQNVDINGSFEGDNEQHFTDNISVTFVDGSIDFAYSEWWGAKADGVTVSHSAINSALLSYKSVKLKKGSYNIESSIQINDNNILSGEGMFISTIIIKSGIELTRAIEANNVDNWIVTNLGIDNSENYPDENTVSPTNGVFLGNDFPNPINSGINANDTANNAEVSYCFMKGITGMGIQFGESTVPHKNIRVLYNRFEQASYVGKVILVSGGTSQSVKSENIIVTGNITNKNSCQTYRNAGIAGQNSSIDGIHLDRCQNFTVTNNIVNFAGAEGIRIEECIDGVVDGNTVYESGQSGIAIYNSSFDVVVSDNNIRSWGRVPNFAGLRIYTGDSKYYQARETALSGVVNLPADPSSVQWIEENIYSFVGHDISNVPDYNNNNYAVGTPVFNTLPDGGDITNQANFDIPTDQGFYPFRGYAAIVVSQSTQRVTVVGNRMQGDITQDGGLYTHSSDFGISIVHNINNPLTYNCPITYSGNSVKDVIRDAYYLPDYVDPINRRGSIAYITRGSQNTVIESDDQMVEQSFTYDSDTRRNFLFCDEIPKTVFSSGGYIRTLASQRPSIGTGEFGCLLIFRINGGVLDSTTRYIFDAANGGALGSGFQVSIRNNRIQYKISDGVTPHDINYTSFSSWGDTGFETLAIYMARDANGTRLLIRNLSPGSSVPASNPEELSQANGSAYDMDSGTAIGIGGPINSTSFTLDMDLYHAIIWNEAFTKEEVESRLKTHPLIKAGDSVIFDFDNKSYGNFYSSRYGNIQAWKTESGVFSSKQHSESFAAWQSSTNGSEWITGIDQKCLPDDFVITIILAETAGTPTIQVGSTAGGSDLIGSIALPAGLSIATVNKRSSTAKISVTSNTADIINWSVIGHRARI